MGSGNQSIWKEAGVGVRAEWIAVGLSTVTAITLAAQSFLLRAQTRLLRSQLMAQQYAEYTRRYREIVASFPEAINDQNFQLRGVLSDEREKIMRAMRAYFDLCFEEWHLHELKLIERDVWGYWSAGIGTAMSRAAFREAWKDVRTSAVYPTGFVEDIDTRAR